MPVRFKKIINLNTQSAPLGGDPKNVISVDTGDASDKITSVESKSGVSTTSTGVTRDNLVDKRSLGTKLQQSSIVRKTSGKPDVRMMTNFVKPVIIASLQFLPAFSTNGDEKIVKKMIDLQITAKNLVIDDISHMLGEMREDDVMSEHITSLEKNYRKKLEEEKSKLQLFGQILSKLEASKDTLDVKKSDKTISDSIKGIKGARPEGVLKGDHSSFHDVSICHLKFSDESFKSFSNSRIILQLLVDLKQTMEDHSPQLLTSYCDRRVKDRNPVTLDTQPVRDEEFSFSRQTVTSNKQLAKGGKVIDPLIYADFRNFIRSLPADEMTKIKLLTAFISKELRISAGIEKMRGTKFDEKFKLTTSSNSVIARIIGDPGENITDVSSSTGVTSIVKFKDTQDNYVLPLERRAVTDKSGTVFLPGTFHMIDGILESDNRPDLTQLGEYAAVVSTTMSDFNSVITNLMNFDDKTGSLSCVSVTDLFFSKSAGQLSELYGTISKSTSVITAIFNMSQHDDVLRHLLFKYVEKIKSGSASTGKTKSASDDNTGSSERGSQTKSKDPAPKKPGSFVGDLSNSASKAPISPKTSGFDESLKIVLNSNSIPDMIEERITAGLTRGKGGRLSFQTSSLTKITVSKGEISDILERSAKDLGSLFNAIIGTFESLTFAAEQITPGANSSKGGFKNALGQTHSSCLDDNSILMIVFEIMSSIVNEFFSANFSENSDKAGDTLTVVVSKDQNHAISNKMKKMIGKPATSGVKVHFVTLEGLVESLFNSMVREDDVVRDICDLLSTFFSSVTETNGSLNAFFDTKSDSDMSKKMKAILSNKDDVNILRKLTPAQNASNWQGISALCETSDESYMSVDSVIGESKKNALLTLLRESRFGDVSTNARILFVGLPAGTLETLRNPMFTVGKDNSLSSKTSDIVSVNVYRRDPQSAEMIYKPMKLKFDISRYFDSNFVMPEVSGFDKFIDDTAGLTEISGLKGPGKTEKLSEVISNGEYADLSVSERSEMFKNHAVDYLLKLYTRLLTSMDIQDHAFITNDDLSFSTPVDDVIKVSLKSMFGSSQRSPTSAAIVIGNSSKMVNEINAGKSISMVSLATKSTSGVVQKTITLPDSEPDKKVVNGKTGFESNLKQGDPRSSFSKATSRQKVSEEYFKKMINSLLFSLPESKVKAESTKQFDRIFSIMVDPDDFVLDEDIMSKNVHGRRALMIKNLKNDNSTKSSDAGDFTFSEYFVTIEL